MQHFQGNQQAIENEKVLESQTNKRKLKDKIKGWFFHYRLTNSKDSEKQQFNFFSGLSHRKNIQVFATSTDRSEAAYRLSLTKPGSRNIGPP